MQRRCERKPVMPYELNPSVRTDMVQLTRGISRCQWSLQNVALAERASRPSACAVLPGTPICTPACLTIARTELD